jgi:phospholipase C
MILLRTRSTRFVGCGLLLCTAGLLINLNGCGGSNAAQSGITSVSASCVPSSIQFNQTSKCSAVVNGTGNFSSSVTWSVDQGTIDQNGNYTPPENATTASVKATSTQNTSKFGTASVAVTSPIQHVVVIFQENRSPDNLFQDPKLIAAGANIQNYGISAAQPGVHIPLTPVPLGCPPDNCQTYNPDHSHEHAFLDMYDGGKMDGAYKIEAFCQKPGTYCLNGQGNYSYAYVQQSDVAPYFQLAETYTFADNMFQSNQGPSFPAHQYLISGSSAAAPPGMSGDNLLLAENPLGITNGISANATGCTAPADELVQLIDPTTGDESNKVYPCFDRPTLTDLLNAKKISWRYYAPTPGSIWTAPNAISHMCGPAHSTACTASDWTNNVVIKPIQVLTDISNNQVASVSWVIPGGQASDHPVINDGSGPSWVASIVNAIGDSPYWANTAVIIAWDDWGGWYDHVAPPLILNQYEIGFRVPMIVVSPYAKANSITHTFYEFGSILKFIENTFGLGNIAPTATLTYADQFQGTGDLSDCFNFTQTPLTFHTIPAKFDAAHFLNDKRKPTDPDDD